MCGICGIVNYDGKTVHKSNIQPMMNIMKHRGPDDEGIYTDGDVGLGFVRLSILDLSEAGHQPMFSSDKRFVLVFNGEIYNYLELKEYLRKKGYSFSSGTDSEVILAAYQEWGAECQEKFEGMWAFAIYDSAEKSLFISRDRFGIKPFYYYSDTRKFIFASEIPPILENEEVRKGANESVIYDYLLTNRTNHSEQTFFKGIKKLQHGHNLYYKKGERQVLKKRWYQLTEGRSTGYQSSEEFRDDFNYSVNQQLRSDVPVGLCLSGGLDSSSIGAVIHENFNSSHIHSFSAIYGSGKKGDESNFIKEFEGYIPNIHFTTPTIHSFENDLDRFITAQAEPIPNSSAYAEFKVMELANQHNCTVLLNGQGVDEYMAGYHYLIGYLLKEKWLNFKWISLLNEVYHYYKEHKTFVPVKYGMFLGIPFQLQEKLLHRNKGFISEDFFMELSGNQKESIVDQLYGATSLKESFIKHFEHKFEHHLMWADKSGMRYSIETRFPFLHHNMVEKMLSTENESIYKNGITKVLLRDAMKEVLPERIVNRKDKVGYQTPEDEWFRSRSFQQLFKDVIHSSVFQERNYFDIDKLRELNKKHCEGDVNISQQLWKPVHLELWFRKFIDS